MSVSEPGKIVTPWAESGLKNPIPPAANPATGRAGFDQGFSAINMTAKEAGGIPPFGQDFNGIFYEVTNILRYMQAGGQPTFDAALATAIGGYPKGAMVLGNDGLTLWQSKVDSNFTDPNTDPSNWGAFDIGLKADLAAPGGLGLIGDIPKPITWSGFSGGAQGDSASNSLAISAANATGLPYMVPDGYWPNTVDATFNIYPGFRNYSGGYKLKRGIPGSGVQNPYPLIWAEKTSNMQRVDGGTNWFDVAMQGALTLEPTATAFGVGVSGYIRSAAGDVLTAGKWVDAIGVHGSGKAIGRNGRVWGLWGQAGNGDDGSGVRSSQIVACELNCVNLFDSQPHPENLPTGEGPYRGLIVTTADGGKGCGIAIDVGDGSNRPVGESGWWIGLRLRKGGVRPAGDWRNNYLEDTQQLKIEGSVSNIHRYGGIKLGPRADGTGVNFTYGLNTLGATFQDGNAINLGADQRIYWGPVSGIVKWIGYEGSTGAFNFRNMTLAINSIRVLAERQTGIFQLTGTADGTTKNTETVTLQELARYVKKVTDALITHGMIGPT